MDKTLKKEVILYPLKIGHDLTKLLVHFVIPLKCRACKRINLFERDLELLLWEATMNYVCGYGVEVLEEYTGKQVICKCGFTHTIHKPLGGRLCLHFVDASPVIHIDITLPKKGATTFRFRQLGNTGFAKLPSTVTDADVYNSLGRVFNIGAVWNRVMSEVLREKKPCHLKVAPGYTIIGALGGDDGPKRVQEEIANLVKGTVEAVSVVSLRQLYVWKDLQIAGTFTDWAPAFAPLIRNGTLEAYVMLDRSLINDYVIEAGKKINVTTMKISQEIYRATDGEFLQLITPSDVLLSAAISGYTLGEAVYVAVAKAKLQISDLQEYYGVVQASLPGFQLTRRHDHPNANIIAIQKEGQDYGSWNLDNLRRQYSDKEVLRYWATYELPHVASLGMKWCPICNMARVLVRRLKPAQWSRERQDLLIDSRLGECIVVYAFDCLAHTIYVTDDLVSELGLKADDLKTQVNKDIENDTYHLVAGRKLTKGSVSAIWAWGTNAASIALDGRLVGGFLRFLEVDWKGTLHIDVVDTNAIVLYQDSSPKRSIDSAHLALANVMRNPPGTPGMPLNLQMNSTIEKPVGRFYRIDRIP
jgi:hypothetical protein